MCMRYDYAKKCYAGIGVDTDAALQTLLNTKISLHCWQGDDVRGYEATGGAGGGTAVTGNHPGKAQTPAQLMADIDKALSYVPGRHKINLHAIYAFTDGTVPRDRLEPKHFQKWVDFARERGLGLDMNPTLFSHELAAEGLTLAHPDKAVRDFWIRHCKATRAISEYFGRELGQPCLHNIWIPDGLKDVPGDRIGPRARLKDSLDEIFSVKLDSRYIVDSVESKVFGIGAEAYTVGSHEFYMNYAAKNNVLCLLDNGHYHPTESVADKISSLLLFGERVALHVTRPMRWDSDHVVTLNDDLCDLSKELVRCGLDKIMIGLDYFDGSINRVAAWVVGMRNMQKALLLALLTPNDRLKALQDAGDFTSLLVLTEELKSYPFCDVWEQFCETAGLPMHESWLADVLAYEQECLAERSLA